MQSRCFLFCFCSRTYQIVLRSVHTVSVQVVPCRLVVFAVPADSPCDDTLSMCLSSPYVVPCLLPRRRGPPSWPSPSLSCHAPWSVSLPCPRPVTRRRRCRYYPRAPSSHSLRIIVVSAHPPIRPHLLEPHRRPPDTHADAHHGRILGAPLPHRDNERLKMGFKWPRYA